MSKSDADILMIRKYLNGELDARAMHELEKRAQDDPFLMDAIEGYEKAKSNQQSQLNELAERLHNRVTSKKARIIPFRVISIAASVLVVLCIGGWWLYSSRPVNKPQMANITVSQPEKKVADSAKTPVADKTQVLATIAIPSKKKYPTSKQEINAPITPMVVMADKEVAIVPQAVKKDSEPAETTPLNEMVVMQYNAEPKKQYKVAANNDTVISTALGIKKTATPTDKLLQGKVAGVTTEPAEHNASAGAGYLYDSNYLAKAYVKGRVIAKDDGAPLAGVTIKVAGTNKTAQTDIAGRFSIPVDSGKSNKLVVNYVGFQTATVSANNRDSLKTIALQPNNSSLNEVVVTGYSAQNKEADENAYIAARPREGWNTLKKYLQQNAISPDSKTGTVKLAVTIGANGNITSIKVIKGLSTATDQKAVDLINNGPAWSGSSNRKPQTVTVRVKFGN
ncbi:carboxypeptidase-like regulatory domain-containing protein [Mucilaginibacter sp. X4EP1]|uniref:carboxypeptidase-like regulatory domain-containing protein n=1 Tax=Mucilaginibacter sp. X4EP1 TaxID=2723092 RepID=UPI0021696EE8|nr:carboxypeptidase-like regulatory domain-containing protein [Mucilaginibacter sp. X4EP1]MCS3811832.1 outer membrane biosynthesis protein TonB [Mucilaginibacter sp. X4EP1]